MATCEDTSNGISLDFKKDVYDRKILTSGYTRKSKPNGKTLDHIQSPNVNLLVCAQIKMTKYHF